MKTMRTKEFLKQLPSLFKNPKFNERQYNIVATTLFYTFYILCSTQRDCVYIRDERWESWEMRMRPKRLNCIWPEWPIMFDAWWWWLSSSYYSSSSSTYSSSPTLPPPPQQHITHSLHCWSWYIKTETGEFKWPQKKN